jgi:hypothetical protein
MTRGESQGVLEPAAARSVSTADGICGGRREQQLQKAVSLFSCVFEA